MRANEIVKKIHDMQYDADHEFRTLCNEKSELESALSSYQSELQQLYQRFAKTQIMQNLETLSPDVQNIVHRTNEKAANNRKELVVIENDISEIKSNRARALEALAAAKDQVRKTLYFSPEHKELADKVYLARESLEIAETSGNEICLEVTPKIEAYRANMIFSYLMGSCFGTDDYSSNFLIAKLDNQIARKYGYHEMKGNFDLLHLMKSAALDADKEAKYHHEAMSNRLKKFEDEAHQTPQMHQAIADFDRLEAELTIAQQDKQRLEMENKSYLNFTDDGHSAAIQNVIHNLNVMQVEQLRALAQATDSLDDDNALAGIEHLLTKVKSKTITLNTCELAIKKVKRTLSKVKSLSDIVDGTQYSNKNYRYSNAGSIESLLIGYVAGQATSDSLLSGLRQQSRYDPEVSHSSSSYGSSDSFSTSSSISSESFSTTDSF